VVLSSLTGISRHDKILKINIYTFFLDLFSHNCVTFVTFWPRLLFEDARRPAQINGRTNANAPISEHPTFDRWRYFIANPESEGQSPLEI
jgi:hypothetical protein